MEGKTFPFPSLSAKINTVLSKRSLPDELSNSYYIRANKVSIIVNRTFQEILLSQMPPSSSPIRIGNHRRKDLQYILSLANMYISNLNQISRGKERKSSTRFSKPWPRFSRAGKSVDDKEEQRRGKREGSFHEARHARR